MENNLILEGRLSMVTELKEQQEKQVTPARDVYKRQVLFFIKRSKLLKNGEAPVRVRVTYDRLYVELQLKRSVKVPLWSQEKEKSTGKDRNSVELNHYIDALRVKFYQIYQDLELAHFIIVTSELVIRNLWELTNLIEQVCIRSINTAVNAVKNFP